MPINVLNCQLLFAEGRIAKSKITLNCLSARYWLGLNLAVLKLHTHEKFDGIGNINHSHIAHS